MMPRPAVAGPGGVDGGPDLGRVMGVVVDHGDPAGRPQDLEAPGRPPEVGAGGDALRDRGAGKAGEGQGRGGVEGVVPAGEGERHLGDRPLRAVDAEALHRAVVAEPGHPPAGALALAVDGHRAGGVVAQRERLGIVAAEHQQARPAGMVAASSTKGVRYASGDG